MKAVIRVFSALLIILIVAICSIVGYYIYTLPNNYLVSTGDHLSINGFFTITAQNNELVSQSNLNTKTAQREFVTLKLFGTIPIKDVSITSIDKPVLIAGGNPFGIKMLTKGVMIVDLSTVDTLNGKVSPAKNCGIVEGDIILEINEEKIYSIDDVQNAVKNSNGNDLSITLNRKNSILNVVLSPKYSLSDASYKAGIWLRDSAAGIGTITFYDPNTETFGGLGHPICDVDTGQILPLQSGEVVNVNIKGVKRGEPKNPGELLGTFVGGFPIGTISINNITGVFGNLNIAPNHSSPIPIAFKQEVKKGYAQMLTTINGNIPCIYDVEIEEVRYDENEKTKNMIVKITDPELLKETGGILQGMSGSPLIQDGKIIGAVTHVFVNDPTKGYAIFIENMLETAESIEK